LRKAIIDFFKFESKWPPQSFPCRVCVIKLPGNWNSVSDLSQKLI
jgi:hypothetical protein